MTLSVKEARKQEIESSASRIIVNGLVTRSQLPLAVKIGVRSWNASRVPVGRRFARLAVPVSVWETALCEKEGGRWSCSATGPSTSSSWSAWWSTAAPLELLLDAASPDAAGSAADLTTLLALRDWFVVDISTFLSLLWSFVCLCLCLSLNWVDFLGGWSTRTKWNDDSDEVSL